MTNIFCFISFDFRVGRVNSSTKSAEPHSGNDLVENVTHLAVRNNTDNIHVVQIARNGFAVTVQR